VIDDSMTRSSTTLSDAVESARELGDRFVGSARDLGDRVVGTISGLLDELGTRTKGSLEEMSDMSLACSCESCRRRACWMPDERPRITSKVSPCGTARVRFTVHNCGLGPRQVFVAATGEHEALVFGAPSTATIEALDTATLVAELKLPDSITEANVILWVRGCKDTAVRWTVTAKGCALESDHHVHIEDCPDTQHYWYDHFAQPRDCRNRRRG
jgi:hypothetical protein